MPRTFIEKDIVKRDMGAIVTPRMLADLVLHKQGLFQYSKGKKILFLRVVIIIIAHYEIAAGPVAR